LVQKDNGGASIGLSGSRDRRGSNSKDCAGAVSLLKTGGSKDIDLDIIEE
jgi:hypothetical protein